MPLKKYRNKNGQFTTEYLIVVSIALSLIGFFLVYVFVYYSGYYNTSISSKVSNAATTIVNEANYVSSEGLGSKISFSLNMPDLTISKSFFCGNYVKIVSGTYSYVAKSNYNLTGVLPTTGGNYVGYATYNNSGVVQIGLKSQVSYINTSYSLTGSSLNYNIEFFGSGYTPSQQAYNISVFTSGGQYINSTKGSSTPSGVASSFADPSKYPPIHLSQVSSTLLIYVFALNTNVMAPTCFKT